MRYFEQRFEERQYQEACRNVQKRNQVSRTEILFRACGYLEAKRQERIKHGYEKPNSLDLWLERELAKKDAAHLGRVSQEQKLPSD